MDFIFHRQVGARVSDKLLFKDLTLVVVENDAIRVVVVPEKGADIVSFVDKKTGVDVMLRLPTGLRSFKSEMPLMAHPNTLFSYYEGGWQELFPVGSSFGKYYGADHPTHGEAPLLEWDYNILEDSTERVCVEFRVRTKLSPFELRRRMILDASSPEVVLEESIENLSTMDLSYMWGHHPAFGAPFLSGDCRIELPKSRLFKGDKKLLRLPPESEPRRGMFYALDLKRGIYGIHNDRLGFGFGMSWDHRIFSKIWIWQSMHIQDQSPYFKREYACAIEPFTSLPHQLYGKRDRLPVLKAGQKLETSLKAFIYRRRLPA
ncbi:MAG: aldose 1-epimerase [Verrucomicrobiae bacterium]|nr:aldose 1-epimerase [Verrucomicrobiae bacterium]